MRLKTNEYLDQKVDIVLKQLKNQLQSVKNLMQTINAPTSGFTNQFSGKVDTNRLFSGFYSGVINVFPNSSISVACGNNLTTL